MTVMEKEAFYDRLSRTLTNYEVPEIEEERTTETELYEMLVEIQCAWEELTGETQ